MATDKFNLLQKYDPPTWATRLKSIPRYYVELAQCNTPVTEWNLDDVTNGFKIGIKRDDMTGSTLTGNKVRKLEFLLADAIAQNCDSVITSGVSYSNHCRATAIAARQLGLKCYLFLRVKEKDYHSYCHGNNMLTTLTGSDVFVTEYSTPVDVIESKMKEFSEHLRCNQTSSAYVIPGGGSSYLGMFGYIKCFQELMEQNILDNYTDIFVTSGSTGTAAALAVSNYLTGSKLKVHAVSVSRQVNDVYDAIQKELDIGGVDVRSQDIIDVMMAYRDFGHGESTQEEIDDIIKITRATGILLDPVYTVKTVRRMLVEMKENPTRFKGRKVLFIHTGGMFELFAQRLTAFWSDSQQK